MRSFPAESIDMVMFSPPYWGLRSYGKETEVVWSGDPQCKHKWGSEIVTKTRGALHGPNANAGNMLSGISGTQINQGNFCVKCGAWRGQLGLEPYPQMYVDHMVIVCHEVKRVLKKTGSMYIVLGDTYAGSHCGKGDKTLFQNYRRLKVAGNLYDKPNPQAKSNLPPKCLIGVPWRVALALINDGWILRNDICWFKPNAMPSSVKDRLTTTWEHIFHLVKARRYYYDLDAIREPHSSGTFKRIFQRNVFKQKGGQKQLVLRGEKKSLRDRGSRCIDMVKSLAEKYVKHDLAVGRMGNFSYSDPLHVKEYHPKGKNPGDIIKVKSGKYKAYGIHSPGERNWYWSEQRQNLPKPRELIAYLKKHKGSISYREIDKALGYEGDRSSHWFTDPHSEHGFAYPSKEDWLKLKELLKFDDRFDKQMTETVLVPVTDLGHPKGKNPGDVIKWANVPGQDQQGNFGHGGTHGNRFNHPLGRNPGNFWSISTRPFKGAHFAVYPEEICMKPIKASCPHDGIVLDPMCGSGTTLVVALKLGRRYIGIDINPDYVEMAGARLASVLLSYKEAK